MKSIWIARDRSVIPEDLERFIEKHPEKEYEFGKLHIFYDSPKWDGVKWISRDMCEVQDYMFPEIEPGMCVEFKTNEI